VGLFGVLLGTMVVYALLARRLAPWGISGPIIFLMVGLASGPLGISTELLGPAEETASHGDVHSVGLVILEIALALTLFSDAANLRPRSLGGTTNLSVRLLAVGMPLTIVAGTLVALGLMPDLLFWECVILATVLAPTDAALGQAVVSSPAVPKNVRHALNVESGLNDGMSVPVLFLALALAANEASLGGFRWVTFAVEQIGYGAVVGLAVGVAASVVFPYARERGWMAADLEGAGLAAVGVGAWLLADAIGGNGFIAAFVAGLALHLRRHVGLDRARDFGEEFGALLDMTAFFIFGLVAWEMFGDMRWESWLYAVLSLTVIRMLPVAVSLLGSGLRPVSVGFMGWFGPRGLASIVLGLVVLEEQPTLSGLSIVLETTVAAVFLSIVAHGVTAPIMARAYGRLAESLPRSAPELAGVETEASDLRPDSRP
jgi:NhaP-type Na+/H+ or K+/H+ antiporter